MTTQTYRDAADHLLAQADRELIAGDYRQAAEKAWGAAALATKAMCVKRRWSHQSHGVLRRAAKRLSEEVADEEIRLLFYSANLLHQNFYEDTYNEAEVSLGMGDVRRFIDKLETLP